MGAMDSMPGWGRLRPIWCLIALAAVGVTAATSTTASGSVRANSTPPHITVIGDSVLTAVLWYPEPLGILTKGLDVDMQVAVCRRLVGVSCPFEGQTPSTLVDLADTFGPKLGKIVVVEAGYNEPEAEFADAIERSLAALRTAGVTRVLWVSLSERRAEYTRMNATLAAAARKHPELTIVDWASLTHANDNWFQGDGVHLTYAGAIGMARLLRMSLDQEFASVAESGSLATRGSTVSMVATSLPTARVGRWFDVLLLARGGMLPYRWSVTRPLPQGLHLTLAGRLYGVVRQRVETRLTLRVQDGSGRTVSRSFRLVVGG
jgi:hypothetical protein